MKRTTWAVLALAAMLATTVTFSMAYAESHMESSNMEHTAKGGLGFLTTEAPIGIRWWFTDQVGIDAGVGFTSTKIPYTDFNNRATDESFNRFSVDVGIPWALKRWDKVHFLFRPGVLYTSEDSEDYFFFFVDNGQAGVKEKINTYSVTGELELEVFLAKNASISASHGLHFASTKLDIAGSEAVTSFGTFGSDFTTLGFHVYLWE